MNVNSLEEERVDYDPRINNESWSYVKQRNPSLRITVNFLIVEETQSPQEIDKYKIVLNAHMPLQKLRMYFCKSLTPNLIQYISDSYSDLLGKIFLQYKAEIFTR